MIQIHGFRYAAWDITYQDLDLPHDHLVQNQIGKIMS